MRLMTTSEVRHWRDSNLQPPDQEAAHKSSFPVLSRYAVAFWANYGKFTQN